MARVWDYPFSGERSLLAESAPLCHRAARIYLGHPATAGDRTDCAGGGAASGWSSASTLRYGCLAVFCFLKVFLACHLLLLGSARADDGEPRRMIASAGMDTRSEVGGAGQSSEWDVVIGKEWFVLELGGHPVLEGTSITIVFHIDGRVSGNAGTNNYRGHYERTGLSGLKVFNLGATKMYRDIPPGRMQQEARYLETLKAIDRYTLENDELSLWTGSDRSIRYTLVH
jgi:heat shock protein HslJ